MRNQFHVRRCWGQDRAFLMIDFSQKWRRIVCILAPSDVLQPGILLTRLGWLSAWLGISETLDWWLDWFLSDVQRIGKQILSVQDFDKNLAVHEWLRIWIPKGSRNPIVKPWNDVNFDDQHCCVCSRPQVYCDVKLGTGGGWRCSSHLVNHWLTVCVMME